MLFYTTEGEFGTDQFKVTAQELFPLDIGTQTYTEYSTSDPELIKFMMANKDVLMMKKGHIHSHNNMGVFFSITDNEELSDNCGFHNFYLSLIVNNKNEMCAKIAFKAKIKSTVNSVLVHKNQDGKDVEKKLSSDKENESIFVYKCNVTSPQGGGVADTFKSRFQELRTAKTAKESKKASEAAKSVGKNFEQAGLFDDVYPGTGAYSKSTAEAYRSHGNGRGVTDSRVYNLLAKLISLDYVYEGTVASALQKIDNRFYDIDGVYPNEAVNANIYFDTVEKNAIDFYINSFPEDKNLLGFDSIMEKCVDILERYDNQYPELITHLSEALNLEIKG